MSKELTEEQKEKKREKGRARHNSLTPEQKEKLKETRRNWYLDNREKIKERALKRLANDPEQQQKRLERSLKWQKDNPERVREIQKKYRTNNPEKVKETWNNHFNANKEKIRTHNAKYRHDHPELGLKWRADNPERDKEINLRSYQKCYGDREKRRAKLLRNKYDLSIEQYNEMFEAQKGCCAICKKHQSEYKVTFHVDHNHTTGAVRGLLCFKCNSGIGMLQDSPDILQMAAEYIKRNST